jgi:predicted aspartyl protease
VSGARRRVCALLAFAVTAAFGSLGSASADDVPTADELVARSKLAASAERRPETERELWDVRIAGLEGTLETVRREADFASTTLLGPFRTARGVWHGERWHQNENGETILERPEPSQSERPILQSVARVRDPVDAWMLVTTFASGHVARTYYDPRSSQLIRTEHVTAGHETHTTYEDFRTDARGRTRPWHYFGGDDRPDNDFDFRLVRDDLEPDVDEADVAVPHDRRTLVEFPAGSDSVRLPARIVGGRIYVRLDVGGRGLDFLLDTGSAALTIDDGVARELGLQIYGKSTQTVAGSFATGRVIVPALSIGALELHDVVMRTVPYSATEARSIRVVGLLGYDFLSELGLKIDYASGEIDAFRPGTLAPPPTAGAIDVRLNSGAPVARASVGTATGEDFIIDTGAAFSVVIFQRFARAHPEALELGSRESYGNGVGGTFGYRSIATKKIVLGPWSFDDAAGVEALSANAFGFDNEDGLIGSDILKRFTVYLDYPSSRVFLAATPRSGVESASARAGDARPSEAR